MKTQFIDPVANLKTFNDDQSLVLRYQAAFKKCLSDIKGLRKDILVNKLDKTVGILELF